MSNETGIPLSKEVRAILKSLKRGGESYDSLLRRLLKRLTAKEFCPLCGHRIKE